MDLHHLAPTLLLLSQCTAPPAHFTPSDDPGDYLVDDTTRYEVQLGAWRQLVPSDGLPAGSAPMAANNNVDIVFHEGRLFMAWRTAETHFASKQARIEVISSDDSGHTWIHEHTIAMGTDVREPRFLRTADGALLLHWFESGSIPATFAPRWMWRAERVAPGRWSAPQKFGDPGEVPWTMKGPRNGRYYMTSYLGQHYGGAQQSDIDLRFRVSDDGRGWRPLTPGQLVVYRGGVSEAAFEFDADGNLWAVTRNEDGDATGFGSHLCQAFASELSGWRCPAHSAPERYDSPWIFRHAGELYLVARRDVGGPYDQGLPGLTLAQQRSSYLVAYSLRPKRTALYHLDRTARRVVHLVDLPGVGDTAFASVRRTGPHTFLLANYTSPLNRPDVSWLAGQTAAEGTQIYLMTLSFVPASN